MREPKIVLISGTRKGIGYQLAQHFVTQNALVEGCSRKPVDWELTNYTHHIVDVTDETQVKSMVSSIQKKYGRLDILINNAGIASMNHTLLMPTLMVDRIMTTNFRGTFLFCREAAKLMRKSKHGRIVNFSTVAVPMHLEGEAIYAASKSAVTMFSKVFAREVAQFGITCNVIGPSPVETDLIRAVPKNKIDALVDRLAIKRLGTFKDITNVIDFFIKPESDYITGQIIYLGGVG